MDNFNFWKLAFERGWCTAEQLRGAVRTPTNPAGEITAKQYEEITGEKY